METINFAFMKFFDFLVKIVIFGQISIFWEVCVMHYGRNRTLDWGKTRDMNLPKKRRNALKMVILTKKSKLFIKTKLTVSKSCLLGPVYFMIYCILEDAHLQNLSFLRGLSTEFIFFNFSDTATYSRKLENQN